MPEWILWGLGLLKSAAGAALKALADWRVLAVLAVVGTALLALYETRRADGLVATLRTERGAFQQEQVAFRAEKARSAALEAARASEHTDAVQDASDAARACQARVDAARRSSTAITQLLNEPPHAPPDPSEPELIPADRLWGTAGR